MISIMMQQLVDWVRSFYAEPTVCGTCGRDLSDVEPWGAIGAPGRYCSEVCADEGTSHGGW
jgi:hypothetical protein